MVKSEDKERVFVYGASGHAKVVIDIIEKQGLHEVAFLVDDDQALKGSNFFGYDVIGGKAELLALENVPRLAFVAIGNNQIRSRVANWLSVNNFDLISAIHPKSIVGRNVSIGAGSVIMAGAVINSDTRIGQNVIVNTCASVDHDCQIADGVHLAPGSTLCGSAKVGDGSFICAGATVAPNLSIGKRVTVGAGATVIKNIEDDLTVVGVPAAGLGKVGVD